MGYLGKLIPQKGVDLLLQAHRMAEHPAHALVVGFGSHREWLAALAMALERGDAEGLAWLHEVRDIPIEAKPDPRLGTPDREVTFTGRLDHRYAPDALAAMDVMIVPSILSEAFGMVAAEGAAAGALPLVARHSGLGEVGAALESAIGRPGLLTFDPGPGGGGAARIGARSRPGALAGGAGRAPSGRERLRRPRVDLGPDRRRAPRGGERRVKPDGQHAEPLVREGGVEPPRPFGHRDLNPARLPFRHSPDQGRR